MLDENQLSESIAKFLARKAQQHPDLENNNIFKSYAFLTKHQDNGQYLEDRLHVTKMNRHQNSDRLPLRRRIGFRFSH